MRITDFGLAAPGGPGHCRTGGGAGRDLRFMPVELFVPEPVMDIRCDIYSLSDAL